MVMPRIEVQVDSNTASAEAGLDRVEKGMRDVVSANKAASAGLAAGAQHINAYGRGARVGAAHTANLTAQFNDIGVMLAAGQSPLVLAMQQGTQISQVFTQMGGTAKTAFGGIKAGLLGMMSPLSLGTIAVIAGGAALFQWGRSALQARDDGSEFEDLLEEINESLEEGERRIEAYRRGFENIHSLAIDDEIKSITEQIHALNEAIRQTEMVRGGPFAQSTALQRERVEALQEERNLMIDKLDLLESQKQRESEAAEVFERALAAQHASKAAIEATAGGLQTIVDLSSDLATNAWNAAGGFKDAIRAMGIANLAANQSQQGRGNAGPGGPTSAADMFIARTGGMFVERDDKKRGGSRGVGESRADIEALVASLQTEQETIDEWRKVALENLNEANAQELEIIGGHAQAKLRLEDEYQRRLASMRTGYHGDGLQQAQTFFGDMENAMQSGSDKMLKVAKVFGAAEALINSYRAYTAVLADPTLPWFARIPAAVAVMGAGLGMVSAIKGVNAGSSGGSRGSASGGGSFSGGGASQAGQRPSVSLSLIGNNFSRAQIVQIAEAINESGEDGQKIVNVRGRR